ncbi:MAG: hypothetical protein WCG01_03770 [bacterium]
MKSYESSLANSIYEQGKAVNFGVGRELRPIISIDDVEKIKDEKLGFDYRAYIDPIEGYGSVFDGLAFDEKAVRSQSFSILETEKPIAIMTIVIAPKFWIEQQRYFETLQEGVKIIDARGVVKSQEQPDFFVIPAWTQVVSTHKNKLAMPRVRTFKNILSKIEELSPKNTYIETIAQGQLRREKEGAVDTLLAAHQLNDLISFNDLPFDAELMGKNSEGSSSTVKMAGFFGLNKAENICSAGTLGPVFYKQFK